MNIDDAVRFLIEFRRSVESGERSIYLNLEQARAILSLLDRNSQMIFTMTKQLRAAGIATAIDALCPVRYPMDRMPEPEKDGAFCGREYFVDIACINEELGDSVSQWAWCDGGWHEFHAQWGLRPVPPEKLARARSYTPVIAPEVTP